MSQFVCPLRPAFFAIPDSWRRRTPKNVRCIPIPQLWVLRLANLRMMVFHLWFANGTSLAGIPHRTKYLFFGSVKSRLSESLISIGPLLSISALYSGVAWGPPKWELVMEHNHYLENDRFVPKYVNPARKLHRIWDGMIQTHPLQSFSSSPPRYLYDQSASLKQPWLLN